MGTAPSPGVDAARGEVDRAEARVTRLREAYEAGAVVRADVEAAERAARDARERLELLAAGTRRLTPAIAAEETQRAERRLGELRERLEKVEGLHQEGLVARRDLEQAAESVRQAEAFLDLARVREQELAHEWELARRVKEWEARGGRFDEAVLTSLEARFERRFGAPLPLSAIGMTDTHAAMNFNHSGRVDVALSPDSPEGQWLVAELTARDIPFLVYRSAVSGKATGPHIHLGLPSPPLR
jgi:hypothetical protein